MSPTRSFLVALLAFLPALALAGEIEVRSKQVADVMVDGDMRAYYRVVSGQPLGFVLEGPEELSVSLRQDLGAGDVAGELETELMIFQDGYRIRRLTLKEPDGGLYLTGGEFTPTAARAVKIKVPSGKHAYRLELVTKGRSITVAVLRAADDLESMMVVSLVDEEPAVKPAPIPALTPVPWEESQGDPEPAALPPPPVTLTRAPPAADPAKPRPPKGPRTPNIVAGVRVLAAASGVGAPAMGGGAHLLWRSGWLGDALNLGIAVDYVPASARGLSAAGEPRRLDWQSLLFGAALRLTTSSKKPLFWQAQASLGGALVWASTDVRSASSLVPAVGFSFGPSLRLGPGALTLEAQTTILFGEPSDAAGSLSVNSALGGLGLTVGYQLVL